MKIDVKCVLIALIVGVSIAGVAANPQILTYYSGNWYNDRMEIVDTGEIVEYIEISSNPWIIEVVYPELHYAPGYREEIFNNGENITIQKGIDTITITADTTTTLTIIS